MNRSVALTLALLCAGVSALHTQPAPQVVAGRISDSICGASHRAKAGGLTDRQCVFECLKALADWVLVDENDQVLTIRNYDLPGLPLYAGRPVHLTGSVEGSGIVASKVEAYPPHLHALHVMTNWRDTPGGVGLLIAALSDAKVAVAHAELAAREPENLDAMKLHAGHVVHAVDPALEPKGPGSGYGVRKAATSALQHLEMAAGHERASVHVKTHAALVAAALTHALGRVDETVALAAKIRGASSASEAAVAVAQLRAAAGRLLDEAEEGGLVQAHARMGLLLKAEGIENAPR